MINRGPHPGGLRDESAGEPNLSKKPYEKPRVVSRESTITVRLRCDTTEVEYGPEFESQEMLDDFLVYIGFYPSNHAELKTFTPNVNADPRRMDSDYLEVAFQSFLYVRRSMEEDGIFRDFTTTTPDGRRAVLVIGVQTFDVGPEYETAEEVEWFRRQLAKALVTLRGRV